MQAPHVPDAKSRELVRELSGLGIPQEDIARLVGISKPTLHSHYKDDLDLGQAEANVKVGRRLFQKCMDGDTASILFWMKCRARWHERHDINVTVNESDVEARDGLRDSILAGVAAGAEKAIAGPAESQAVAMAPASNRLQ